MKKLLLTFALLTTLASACVVDTNGTTISSCNPTDTKATIQDLRDAIAGGATTIGQMGSM